MAEKSEVGRCPSCGKPIWSDHPYAWCKECGTPLPGDILARIPGVAALQTAADRRALADDGRTRTLEVGGRTVPCPVCGHDRYWTRETLMSGPVAAFFDLEWAGPSAANYVCDRCGHVLWFLRK